MLGGRCQLVSKSSSCCKGLWRYAAPPTACAPPYDWLLLVQASLDSRAKDTQHKKRKRQEDEAGAISDVSKSEAAKLFELVQQCNQLANYAGLAQWVADGRLVPDEMLYLVQHLLT